MLNMYLEVLETEAERLKFTEMYKAYHMKMYYKALEVLNDKAKAEDAVQNAFMKLAEDYKDYYTEPVEKMKSLCIIITQNKAIDIARKEKKIDFKSFEEIEEEVAATQETPEEKTVHIESLEESREKLKRAIDKIPLDYGLVIKLKYFHGYSNAKIAKRLNLTTSGVEKKLKRAKDKIKKELETKATV